jgi:hypothetical protein
MRSKMLRMRMKMMLTIMIIMKEVHNEFYQYHYPKPCSYNCGSRIY